MEKITFSELCKKFQDFNMEHKDEVRQFGKCAIHGCIVYKSENWPDKEYSLDSRTYMVSSANKYFMPGMGGNSLYGDNLDGTDADVRLDWYRWDIDYCYICE